MSRFHFDLILNTPNDIRRPVNQAAADSLRAAIMVIVANLAELREQHRALKAASPVTDERRARLRKLTATIKANEAEEETLRAKYLHLEIYVDQDRAVAYLMDFLTRPQEALAQQRQAVIDRLQGSTSSDNLALALDGGMYDLVRLAVLAERCARARAILQNVIVEDGAGHPPLEVIHPFIRRLMSDTHDAIVGAASRDGAPNLGQAAKLAGIIDAQDILHEMDALVANWLKPREEA